MLEDSCMAERLTHLLFFSKRLHNVFPKDGNLTHSEMGMIFFIDRKLGCEKDGMRINTLSRMLQVASPTVTQQVSALEKKGYLTRTMDPDDRRGVLVALTDQGRNAVEEANNSFKTQMNGLISYLGQERSEQLINLLVDIQEYFRTQNNL